MSSTTNSLAEIISKAQNRAITAYLDKFQTADNIERAKDEAIAAVLALLPEKHNQQLPGTDSDEQRCRFYRDGGFNFAIDQTRRNLIGEQHG